MLFRYAVSAAARVTRISAVTHTGHYQPAFCVMSCSFRVTPVYLVPWMPAMRAPYAADAA